MNEPSPGAMIETLQQRLLLLERERSFWNAELHDTVVQQLIAARMFLDSARSRSLAESSDPTEAIDAAVVDTDECVQQAEKAITQAIVDARQLLAATPVFDTPDVTAEELTNHLRVELARLCDRSGLASELRSFHTGKDNCDANENCEATQQAPPTETPLETGTFDAGTSAERTPIPPRRIDSSIAQATVRILQEAVNNAIRHGQGVTRIQAIVTFGPREFGLAIRDNGRGISEDSLTDPQSSSLPAYSLQSSFGIHGMRQRARAFGGEFHIAAIEAQREAKTESPGENPTAETGTVVEIRMPYQDALRQE